MWEYSRMDPPSKRRPKEWRSWSTASAGRLCSSYSGECVSLLKALKWLLKNPQTSLICTDCLSLHDALESNDWRDKDPLLNLIKVNSYSNPSQITLLWISSHCGIEGNKAAERLANKGEEMCQDDVPVTHLIMKAKLKLRSWEVIHDRARATYGERRKTKVKVKRKIGEKPLRSSMHRARAQWSLEHTDLELTKIETRCAIFWRRRGNNRQRSLQMSCQR